MKYITLAIILSFPYLSFASSEKEALKQIKSFGKELKKELKAGMKVSTETAIDICNIKAPKIRIKNSNDKIKIGRVSLKNRNKNNYPEKWMLSYIEKFHNKEINKNYITVKLDKDQYGLLKPIYTTAICLNCHGSNLKENVKNKISEKYPNDKAINYKIGEIRGFFWAKY